MSSTFSMVQLGCAIGTKHGRPHEVTRAAVVARDGRIDAFTRNLADLSPAGRRVVVDGESSRVVPCSEHGDVAVRDADIREAAARPHPPKGRVVAVRIGGKRRLTADEVETLSGQYRSVN